MSRLKCSWITDATCSVQMSVQIYLKLKLISLSLFFMTITLHKSYKDIFELPRHVHEIIKSKSVFVAVKLIRSMMETWLYCVCVLAH